MKAMLRRVGVGLLCVLMIAQGADMVLRSGRYIKGQREQHRESNSKARAMQAILWLGADQFGAPATGIGLGSAAMVGLVFVFKGGRKPTREDEKQRR